MKATKHIKNPAAVALGRLGGQKGGYARAAKLTAEERSAIATKAVNARWGRHHRAKLYPDQVLLIRRLHAIGYSQNSLAEIFEVSQPTIGQVVHRDTWRDDDGMIAGIAGIQERVDAAFEGVVSEVRAELSGTPIITAEPAGRRAKEEKNKRKG